MLRTFALLGLLTALPVSAVAQVPAGQQQSESGKPPQRIRSITLTGNQACPKSTDPDAEIVVCARQGEPYRIPKELRDDKPIAAQNQSWVNRTAVADEAGRRAGGLPDTCSPVGSGGQTGCSKLRAERFAAERTEARRQADIIP